MQVVMTAEQMVQKVVGQMVLWKELLKAVLSAAFLVVMTAALTVVQLDMPQVGMTAAAMAGKMAGQKVLMLVDLMVAMMDQQVVAAMAEKQADQSEYMSMETMSVTMMGLKQLQLLSKAKSRE